MAYKVGTMRTIAPIALKFCRMAEFEKCAAYVTSTFGRYEQ
jgi:hypothetical protein